ncbi:MAG: alpha/beta hydrolase fold domain-containing protein, partial [Bryobacter sp.]|nr:alpha/beta hydrolase fold domain-containing protein [Bryobacter sp.]
MLDLWVPNGDGPFPLVIWIHGGAFRAGSKASPPPFPDRLMPRGFAFASIGYRLSSEAIWPAQIQDVKAAVRFLRANAARYKLNPERFGVIGASAGSHLAAMLGTSATVTTWDTASMTNAGTSSRVQSVVNQFGPMDFAQMDAMQMPSCQAGTTSTASSPESQLLGCTIGTCAEKTREASPVTYADANSPPFLVVHGSNDCNISPEQSRLLVETLARAGARPIFRIIPGAGHGGTQFDNANYLALVDSFFVRTLQPAAKTSADSAEFQSAAVAPGQLVSVFGAGLASANAVASGQPWPSSLAGVGVKVVESGGAERSGGLVFVSPGQVNLVLPQELASGPATLTVVRDGSTVQQDQIQVIKAAPALFVQPVNGLSRPLGELLYTDASGAQQRAPLLTT